jgi:PAS domain S-box-containing protein
MHRPGSVFSQPRTTSGTQAVLESALEESPQGALVLNTDQTILFANSAAQAMFGYSLSELVGQPIGRLMPEWSGPQVDALNSAWPNQQKQTAASQPIAGVRRDGVGIALDVGVSLVAEGPSCYVVASMVDVSERLNLEARLSAASHEQLGFQRLVADIAARLVAAAPADVDAAIVDSLRLIGEALNVDRVIVWQQIQGEEICESSHHWIAPPYPAPPGLYRTRSIPSLLAKLEAGEAFWFSKLDDVADPIDRELFEGQGSRSGAVFPVSLDGGGHRVSGALAISSMSIEREWVPAIRERLRLVSGVIGQALARKASDAALEDAREEVRELRQRLTEGRNRLAESFEFRREVKMLRASLPIVSESPTVKRSLTQVQQVAATPATVLLLGETGSGKEVFAQAIHDFSPRHQRQMVRVSCAAIPSALMESELFGRERGAYTGALSRQVGRFEAANQSTLFLDEIGELPLEVQVKLLRVLQDRTIERLGSTQQIKVDIRIIAATNRDLEKAVANGTFREDLYYRLNVFPIVVPPLRERLEDIPGLVWAFIDEFSKLFGKTIESISKDSMRDLKAYAWPGNVRELRNVIERAVILATDPHLVVSAPRAAGRVTQAPDTLEALEIQHIRSVLESTGWRVRGHGGAAERLGLKPTTLESRMARLGISRQRAAS